MTDMETKIKVIHSQDAGLKKSPKNSGETSLNLSTEIMEYIVDTIPEKGKETLISFLLYKEDFLKGFAYIITNLPLYKSSSKYSTKVDFSESYFNELYSSIQEFFGEQKVKNYDVHILRRSDSRIYLNALRKGSFSIRDFLIEEISVLKFSKEHGKNVIRLDIVDNLSESVKDEITEDFDSGNIVDNASHQVIYYGAPGTGKSHKIKEQLVGIPKENIFRTTFHPDSDYSTFVGAYKPTRGKRPLYGLFGKETVRLNDDGDLSEDTITYEFIPQTFLNAYMQAYMKPYENVYLIIEEINRGNCAQIFGDLFQLLDRDENGASEYTIKADADLKVFLEEKLGKDKPGIEDGELCLPSNLFIYATMNTSDQSLFPIDSAFKRRWDWEYEPIKYKNEDWFIDIDGLKYRWSEFQKEVNDRILKDTGSEDKMLGDYFVNPATKVISYNLFRNKILFYLWNDVCKDGDADIFPTDEDFSFSKLYDEDCGQQLIVSMMTKLKLKPIDGNDLEDNGNESNLLEDDDNNLSSIRYSINGEETDEKGEDWGKGALVKRAVEIYCQNKSELSANEVRDNWINIGFKIPHIVETEEDKQRRLSGSKDKTGRERCKSIELKNGEFIYVSTEVGSDKVRNTFEDFLSKIRSKPEWGINIQEL